jgi:PAS domain S-box-containing protein
MDDMGEGNRFFETVLDCVADGVFTVDQEWRITSFNRAAERITGLKAEDVIGRRCAEVLHSNLCERDCPIRESLATGEEVLERSAKITTRRSRSIPITVSSAVLRSDDGTVIGAVETFRDQSAIEHLRRELNAKYTFEDIIGKSEAFQRIFSILPDVAASESTVLIEGPSGSGKELIARAIHNLSPRKKRPYVVVNCGALPHNLFESELFGYKRGAFTDARKDKPGRITVAEGGTIFLDEIGDLPQETQVKLLRLLQEREYTPLGGVETRKADVRIVAATNRDLARLVSQGRFRDDLYFRLAVVRISIPPLRERREDIPYLVDHFIQSLNAKKGKRIQGVADNVMELLMRHELPGNARQIENIIEHAFVLCHNGLIQRRHLPPDFVEAAGPASDADTPAPTPIDDSEADAIRRALRRNHGHRANTAEDLGISRTTLWRKLDRHGIDASEYED